MRFIILLLLVSCIPSTKIRFSIIPTHFYLTNQELIDPLLKIIHVNCIPKEDILVNLKLDYFPLDLLLAHPHEAGATSIFPDLTMLDINIYKYAYMSKKEQETLILHELGHMIGLPHEESASAVMYHENSAQADLKDFLSKVKNHCKNLTDVPRRMSSF